MVAYSFQKRFAEPIREGAKLHTLRDPRRGRGRHARVSEQLQLYTGMRTRHCTLIGRAVCSRVCGIVLKFSRTPGFLLFPLAPDRFERIGPMTPIDDLEAFAWSDGFESFDDMARFWRENHRGEDWAGFLIGWKDLQLPESSA